VSLLGAYPADWPVTLELARGDERWTRIVRLAALEPNLKGEFSPDREVNVQEVRRILAEYQAATLPGGEAKPRFTWNIARETPGEGGPELQLLIGVDLEGGEIQISRKDEGASPGPLITYDDESAVRGELGSATELPSELAMVYRALHVLHNGLLAPVEAMELGRVAVTGADFPAGRTDLAVTQASEPWTVIEWPLDGHTVAKFSFDIQTGLCMRIRVKDIPSGAEATIELLDHKKTGSWMAPGTFEVSGPNYHFRDRLSDWRPVS
jgi:hypothetical protein